MGLSSKKFFQMTLSVLLVSNFAATHSEGLEEKKKPTPKAKSAISKPAEQKPTPVPTQNSVESKIISDSWYTMQAGSTPFGYYHEIIEERETSYSYRYNLTKKDAEGIYQENIGALCAKDLTPIAFNLNKSAGGTTETTNATYSKSGDAGVMMIEVNGTKTARLKRHISKETILDVFFPIWLKNNWNKLKPGYGGWVMTFAEDPDAAEFRPRQAKFEVKGMNVDDNCMNLKVQIDTIKADWCMSAQGVLIDLKTGQFHVRRVKNEKEAKDFVAGIMPKSGH